MGNVICRLLNKNDNIENRNNDNEEIMIEILKTTPHKTTENEIYIV
jgi:hypothetical protein